MRVGERLQGFTSVLPTSVIEIARQETGRRKRGGHDDDSSRSEYSHFPVEVSDLCFEIYLRDCEAVFDPFAGWGERHCAASEHGKKYIGFDINPAAIQRATEQYGVNNTQADSETAAIPYHDGLITCPPYWNLESYSGQGIETSADWPTFLARYQNILERSYNEARVGSFYCILVGDWRAAHKYYDLTHQTRRCLIDECGATLWDEVVISRRSISKIKIMLPQAKRLGYTVKVHETLLVFQKR